METIVEAMERFKMIAGLQQSACCLLLQVMRAAPPPPRTTSYKRESSAAIEPSVPVGDACRVCVQLCRASDAIRRHAIERGAAAAVRNPVCIG